MVASFHCDCGSGCFEPFTPKREVVVKVRSCRRSNHRTLSVSCEPVLAGLLDPLLAVAWLWTLIFRPWTVCRLRVSDLLWGAFQSLCLFRAIANSKLKIDLLLDSLTGYLTTTCLTQSQ